jgi:magnesium transporter
VSVVAAHLYGNGKNVKAVSLDEPIDCKGKSEFVWIGLFEPSERELEQLEKNYGLHPLAIEDALKANQMPKVDVYGDQLFVMTRTAHLEHDHIAYGETAIFVGKNFIISVRHGSARAHSDLRAQLEAAPSLLGQGPDYVLHAILDFIVDGLSPGCRNDRGTRSSHGTKRSRQFPQPRRGQANLRATPRTNPF